MLDRMRVRRCYQHESLLLNGALSANNGEQRHPECSGTKSPVLLSKGQNIFGPIGRL